jgi:hypothetical protein
LGEGIAPVIGGIVITVIVRLSLGNVPPIRFIERGARAFDFLWPHDRPVFEILSDVSIARDFPQEKFREVRFFVYTPDQSRTPAHELFELFVHRTVSQSRADHVTIDDSKACRKSTDRLVLLLYDETAIAEGGFRRKPSFVLRQ